MGFETQQACRPASVFAPKVHVHPASTGRQSADQKRRGALLLGSADSRAMSECEENEMRPQGNADPQRERAYPDEGSEDN